MNKSDIQLRDLKIETNVNKYAEGSVLISLGDTKVFCTASVEEKVPAFLKGTGTGWVSAEYSMLPRATNFRKQRDSSKGKIDGRSQEIQRLIGRSLRSAIDLEKLGERTIWIDCDVIQADGGTRTASISGAFVAMALACKKLYCEGVLEEYPIHNFVGAVSVGILKEKHILDLCYELDSKADVDMNIVFNDEYRIIEIQGTSEHDTFSREDLNKLLTLAEVGCKEIFDKQKEVLGQEAVSLIEKGVLPPANEVKVSSAREDLVDYLKTYTSNEKIDIVVATSNLHKLDEIRKILYFDKIRLFSLKDVDLEGIEIVEDGATFEENALIKAREICKRTGKPSISDDSGLMVDILKGEPGIYSARYAGSPCNDSANNDKLLENMKPYAEELRLAKFVSAIAIVFPNGSEHTFLGQTNGRIGFEPRGDNGFGYDPLFIVEGQGKTYAEMTEEEKNKVSHRYRALKNFNKYFYDIFQS
ncbi:MAG: ribonuclease PH [Filifactor alocis]|nr:ribonuclease PH [Filifactor alocis]